MKRIFLSILVIGILLLGACGAPQAEFVVSNLQVVPESNGDGYEYEYRITVDVENIGGSSGTYNLDDIIPHRVEGKPVEIELDPGEKQTVRLETEELFISICCLEYLAGISDQKEYTVTVGNLSKTVNFDELPAPTPTPTPTTQTEPRLIKEWTGTGIKTTEPFTINSKPWGISWANNPTLIGGQSMGILQIMVYNIRNPDSPITLAANSMEKGSDTSYIYETGTFYLTINAANTQWAVQVWASQ